MLLICVFCFLASVVGDPKEENGALMKQCNTVEVMKHWRLSELSASHIKRKKKRTAFGRGVRKMRN